MALFLTPSEATTSRTDINLETSKKTAIENYQVHLLEAFERNQFSIYNKEKFKMVTFRTDPCPIYNCHGLSFASRRTSIDQASEISKILKDDSYIKVDHQHVLPGDVVLYVDLSTGDFVHSGQVLRVERGIGLVFPFFILSKWGKYKEAIHHVDDCPYYDCVKEYYRINYQQYA